MTIEYDSTPVPLKGEELSEIWWRGRQWAVTGAGIERLNGTYFIDKSRLAEQFSEWSWIRQMGEKSWIDIEDFVTAFMVGIVLHGYAPGFDREQILEDFRKATQD